MYSDNVLDCIGNTPIVKIHCLSDSKRNINVLGKLEGFNPGASIKDRTALQMVLSAEDSGVLQQGGTIVEATSGNLGIALAIICAVKKYKFICVADPKMPQNNIYAIEALGASVVISKKKDSSGSYQRPRIELARRLATELPNAVNLDQYGNESAFQAHYQITGREIFSQLAGNLDVIVANVSTGSHLSGIARYLKEMDENIKAVAVEPEGSVIFGGLSKPFLQNGTGLTFVPQNYRREYIDSEVKVSDKNAFNMIRRVASSEGIILGGSSGAALYAASKFAENLKDNSTILVMLPDFGFKYLNTLYNDNWISENIEHEEDVHAELIPS
ncbi:MAG: cysteine synthase family protein [Ketobacteraceae bacterium]|nr:cysteine synthase family protein [Ketobacteraceae bacterium]